MKRMLRLAVLVGILAVASWISLGAETPVYATYCPGGYPDCVMLAGQGCSPGSDTPCCYGAEQGYCWCSSYPHRYNCAV